MMFGFFKKQQQQQEQNSSASFFDQVHTVEHPYCNNLACWCHTNVEYHSVVMDSTTSEEEMDELLGAAWTLFHNS